MSIADAPSTAPALEFKADPPAGSDHILSEEALAFVADLGLRFGPRIWTLLEARQARQARFDRGAAPDFLPETRAIREQDWTIAEIPPVLQDRRVEITGPVDRKMIINGLNSGARVFMADFEDASSPTWSNMIHGQINIHDAVRRQIDFEDERGKAYRLREDSAELIVRVRGLHLPEKHLYLDGAPLPGALLDFGLHCFHNAHELLKRGSGPWFYIPKLEHWQEAALWSEIFAWAESRLGLARGTIKATVLIETLPAVFQMDEILHAMREHIVGLNCGRWDYIFSYIKVFHAHPDRVLPDREQVGMTVPFLRAYSKLLIDTCHRRGALAMGGMAAQIPVKDDSQANEAAFEKVRADKEREAGDGHDGTWVAHPGLIPVALGIFDQALGDRPNQLHYRDPALSVDRETLLAHPEGSISEQGLRGNIDVGLEYTAAWLAGRGCVPIRNLMEDAATAEIARSQLWQWIHHPGGVLDDGRQITPELFSSHLEESLEGLLKVAEKKGLETGHCEDAARLFRQLSESPEFADFLTLHAYDVIA
ncbi:malate synthase A [Gammaproteobacteria bacterium AB-CW1]|uniref:Malate synthase n=1 Tax=Natronospira elongata TaxID=3110268 RepID=A0AAP6JED9_9GAMM|nr:malate synthase A [Gammaproteobacteria bacterium AB-CW1]